MLKGRDGFRSAFDQPIYLLAAAGVCLGTLAPVAEEESEDQEPDGFMLEEVIVTADRKEQSLLDIPVSVTAFDSDAIEDFVAASRQRHQRNGGHFGERFQLRGDMPGLPEREFTLARGNAYFQWLNLS